MARLRRIRARGEGGYVTAEYAVGAVAACGFGGVLVKVLSSDTVTDLIFKAVTKAFGFAF